MNYRPPSNVSIRSGMSGSAPRLRRPHRTDARRASDETKESAVKYMILSYASQRDYDEMAGKPSEAPVWTPEDFAAMGAFMEAFNTELADSGELVETRALTAPVHTRRVSAGSDGNPVVTDGPYAEAQEVLAGYWIVDCESFDRATELAAKLARARRRSRWRRPRWPTCGRSWNRPTTSRSETRDPNELIMTEIGGRGPAAGALAAGARCRRPALRPLRPGRGRGAGGPARRGAPVAARRSPRATQELVDHRREPPAHRPAPSRAGAAAPRESGGPPPAAGHWPAPPADRSRRGRRRR